MMRPVLLLFALSLCTSVCVGQTDTTRNTTGVSERSSQAQVPIPGVDAPLSAPGTLMQSTPDPNRLNAQPNRRRNRRNRTTPPTDPRAFGVGVPLGKAKRDSL